MSTKQSPAPASVKPITALEAAPSRPAEKAKPTKGKPTLKAHLEALAGLEGLLKASSDEAKPIIRQFANTVRTRLKPFAKITYSEE